MSTTIYVIMSHTVTPGTRCDAMMRGFFTSKKTGTRTHTLMVPYCSIHVVIRRANNAFLGLLTATRVYYFVRYS